MCDCKKDKAASSKNDDANETTPQTQNAEPPDRRPKQGCCRRVLTYEDEANVTVTELPISIPQPPPIAGVAIVRRRIDFGTSPDRKDEASKKADEGTTSEDKGDEQPKDSEKEGGEGKSSTAEAQKETDKTDQQQPTENVVTSTPCPGQLNPNNDCHCTPIPKT